MMMVMIVMMMMMIIIIIVTTITLGKNKIEELHKLATLGLAHILQKILTWNLSQYLTNLMHKISSQ